MQTEQSISQSVRNEEKNEEEVFVQENHRPMKRWFNENPDLKKK